MPKKRQRTQKRFYECSSWDCAYEGVTINDGDPVPMNCGCGEPILGDRYQLVDDDDDDDDYVLTMSTSSPRPGWKKARRDAKKAKATSPGGTIYCQLCGKEIVVNNDGKEEWYSKSGKLHVTSPHLDHYGTTDIPTSITGGVKGVKGDWVERKSALRASSIHTSKSEAEQKEIEREVYNASPLRTTHMMCNCTRPKTFKKSRK